MYRLNLKKLISIKVLFYLSIFREYRGVFPFLDLFQIFQRCLNMKLNIKVPEGEQIEQREIEAYIKHIKKVGLNI